MVSKVGGFEELRAMRAVNRTWQQGFEAGVTRICIRAGGLPIALSARFPFLARLDLGACSMEHGATIPWNALAGLTRLQTLSLGCDTVPKAGTCAANLTSAGLGHCLSVVRSSLPLTSLDLGQCCLGSDPEPVTCLGLLQGMPLASLNLDGWGMLSDLTLADLSGLPLTELSLGECGQDSFGLTEEGFEHLQGMRLASLNLSEIRVLGDACLERLREMPLTRLNLSGCGNLTNAGLRHLRELPLTMLNLSECGNLSEAGLIDLSEMPLKSLNLDGWGLFSDLALADLRGLPLTELSLQECVWNGFCLTDAGLEHLRGMQLTSLNLSDNSYGCWTRASAGDAANDAKSLELC